jgi:hypothetical protein
VENLIGNAHHNGETEKSKMEIRAAPHFSPLNFWVRLAVPASKLLRAEFSRLFPAR